MGRIDKKEKDDTVIEMNGDKIKREDKEVETAGKRQSRGKEGHGNDDNMQQGHAGRRQGGEAEHRHCTRDGQTTQAWRTGTRQSLGGQREDQVSG